MVCQSSVTAFLGGVALLIPRHECNSSVVPSDFDRLIWGYRLIRGPTLYTTSNIMVAYERRLMERVTRPEP